jgi:hypothetical protein
MVDENSPEVQAAYAKAQRLAVLTREWSEQCDILRANPTTTPEQLREFNKVGIGIIEQGLDIAIPFLYDEDFPQSVRTLVLGMMADIPLFRQVNSIK